MTGWYGEPPEVMLPFEPAWHEYMHYLYLPVAMPPKIEGYHNNGIRLPERLEFLRDVVEEAWIDCYAQDERLRDPYVYVTARRGFASADNPLNRPGWHCDDFGGTDLNYIWSDRWPTRVLRSVGPLDLPADDTESMRAMEHLATAAKMATANWEADLRIWDRAPKPPMWIEETPANHLVRLSPYVIHATPEIPKGESGLRSFFKISVSTHRYDLLGNSHNYLFDYDWPMVDREAKRNHQLSDSNFNRDYSGAPV